MTAPHDDSYDRHPAGISAAETLNPEARAEAEAEAEAEAGAAERVITFSDAVVAIAITLLALAITPPVLRSGATNGQVLSALRGQWPDYSAFLISFAVIGSHWATHRRVFRYLGKWNERVGRLNMIWLLMMVLIPVGAKLLAGSGGFGVRFAFYALIQVIAIGCLMLMSLEIARANLLRPGAPARARHPDIVPFVAFCVAFTVSIPVAFVSGWAYAFWVAVPLATKLVRRATANGRHTTSDAAQDFGARSPWIRN